jgi:FkbM family methyltransferase
MRLPSFDYGRATRWVASRHDAPMVRQASTLARMVLDMRENWSYDAALNGEARILELLAPHLRVVFDVGANVGDWTRTVLDRSGAECHCFELVPSTAAELERRLGSAARAHLNAIGLSDAEGVVTAKVYAHNSEISSIADIDHGSGFERVNCAVIRGDAYCRQHGIADIDLLKIDAEGADLSVLRGFGQMVGRIAVIQFEYGLANVMTRTLLADFYELLESRGYVVGKVFPTGVRFAPYTPTMEDFRGPNYLAVLRDRTDLVDLLRA